MIYIYAFQYNNRKLSFKGSVRERGMGLMRLKSAFDLLILLPSVASLRRKMLKTTNNNNNNNNNQF